MKITKTQRRLVRKMTFPIVGLLMMTLAMAIAGGSHSDQADRGTASLVGDR